jgi:hypothetical protein
MKYCVRVKRWRGGQRCPRHAWQVIHEDKVGEAPAIYNRIGKGKSLEENEDTDESKEESDGSYFGKSCGCGYEGWLHLQRLLSKCCPCLIDVLFNAVSS